MRRPQNIPIVWRITAGLLVASILPLLVIAYWGSQRSSTVLREESYKNLRLIAQATGARIDQFVRDTRITTRAASRVPQVVEYAHTFETGARALEGLLRMLAAHDPGVLGTYLTDADGHVRLATDPDAVGMDVSFRDYWRRARAEET